MPDDPFDLPGVGDLPPLLLEDLGRVRAGRVHRVEELFRHLAADRPLGQQIQHGPQPLGGDGALGDLLPILVQPTQELHHDPVADDLGIAVRLDAGLVVGGQLLACGEDARVVVRNPILPHEARALGLGQLGQTASDLVHPGRLDHQGHQVGIREVAIVVGEFLAPHREGDLLVRVPETGLLNQRLPLLDRLVLAPDLVLQRLLDVLEGVHVLDFGLDPQLLLAHRADRDVGVAAEASLLHVPVADPQKDQDRPELPEVLCRLLGGADVRLAHDLHQGKAAPVVVHQAGFRLFQGARMHQLARVLLEMDAVDPDPLLRPVQREGDETALRQGQLVLAQREEEENKFKYTGPKKLDRILKCILRVIDLQS